MTVASARLPPDVRAFLNLSNHPLAAWSPAQLDAARALGLGDPCDLEGGLPTIDPYAVGEDVDARAAEIAAHALAQGAAGAFVSGEPTLTVCLVRRLQRAGVRCFVATTERRVAETRKDDGTVVATREFSFVAWREYPAE